MQPVGIGAGSRVVATRQAQARAPSRDGCVGRVELLPDQETHEQLPSREPALPSRSTSIPRAQNIRLSRPAAGDGVAAGTLQAPAPWLMPVLLVCFVGGGFA